MQSKYPAKLLLFGEYTIINGSMALAVPYEEYFGKWSFETEGKKAAIIKASRDSIRKIFFYLQELNDQQVLKCALNFEDFHRDIEKGIWFDSNIPAGYGVGSSGAVCAGIYDRYSSSKIATYPALQAALAQIESCFHGKSSGIDPLVCYLQERLVIKESVIEVVRPKVRNASQARLFLIDTGISRSTTPLVKYYLEQCELEDFQQDCIAPLSHLNENGIQAYIDGEEQELFQLFRAISQLEYQAFKRMIPSDFCAIWEQGLAVDAEYSLKLCGAGGGGFILGYSLNWQQTEAELKDYELAWLK